MLDPRPYIRCKHCLVEFQPDMKTRLAWKCPACGKKNPNLKRHYRSLADLCILGVLFGGVALAALFNQPDQMLAKTFLGAHIGLLLTAVIFVYKSKAAWVDSTAKYLVWFVYALAFTLNVVLPLVFGNPATVVLVPIYAIIFTYLVWLERQAWRCSAEATFRAAPPGLESIKESNDA